MRNFLNSRHTNYNNVGDKVDDFCEDCENRWLPLSRVWWDSTEKNIADIKRKDNGILVINKILSVINSILNSIKDIYEKIDIIEPPILSEDKIELVNSYIEVGITEYDFQEDLNIAIYENYINLKNTKVDKPLIESTSDSLKIVALDNQGESVFIKSNELGKVKSVNNKIGDVILKTSDLENDSDYTTNSKLNKEIQDRISADNLKLDKPTTNNTNQFVILGDGSTAPKSDFGKVKSVNEQTGDVVLKTSDLQNDSDYTTNTILNIHTNNKNNPHNVTKEQINLGNVDNTSDLNKTISTATQNALNKKIDKPIINNTNEYVLLADGSTTLKGDLGKNFANTDLVVTTNRKHTGTASVEFGFPFICSNASVRYSGLADKSADATFNDLLGVDSNGYAAKVGLNAVTNAMSKSSDAQKDAWRIASLKSTESYSTGLPMIDSVIPMEVDGNISYKQYITVIGTNLYINNSVSTTSFINMIRVEDENMVVLPTEEVYPVTEYEVFSNRTSILNFGVNFSQIPKGKYLIEVHNNGFTSKRNFISGFVVSSNLVENIPINIDWYYKADYAREVREVVSPTSVLFRNIPSTTDQDFKKGNSIHYLSKNSFITKEMLDSGFVLKIKLNASSPSFGESIPIIVKLFKQDHLIVDKTTLNTVFGWNIFSVDSSANQLITAPSNLLHTVLPSSSYSQSYMANGEYYITYKNGVFRLSCYFNNMLYYYNSMYVANLNSDNYLDGLGIEISSGGVTWNNSYLGTKGAVIEELRKF